MAGIAGSAFAWLQGPLHRAPHGPGRPSATRPRRSAKRRLHRPPTCRHPTSPPGREAIFSAAHNRAKQRLDTIPTYRHLTYPRDRVATSPRRTTARSAGYIGYLCSGILHIGLVGGGFGSEWKRVRTTSPGVGKVVECACCRRRGKYGLFRMARTLKESDIRAWILLDGGVAPWLK